MEVRCVWSFCGLLNRNPIGSCCLFCGTSFDAVFDHVPSYNATSFVKFDEEWRKKTTLSQENVLLIQKGWDAFQIGNAALALKIARNILKNQEHQDPLILAVFSLSNINEENDDDIAGAIGSQRAVFLKTDRRFLKYLMRLLNCKGDLEWKYAALSWLVCF